MDAPAKASGDLLPAPEHGGRTQTWLWTAALLLACALPWLVSDYRLFQFTTTLIYAIVLLGLTILTGYSGQISLGHGAFFALGAYTTAILVTRYGMPYVATIPVAALVCLGVGFAFGRPALRLEGHYLALATFALAVATPQLLKHKQLQEYTGGVQGIMFDKPSAPWGLPMGNDTWLYWLTLAVTVLLFRLGHNLLKGRIGRALLAIKNHPTAAAAMGIDIARYKSIAFAISALFTGVAGALSAICVQFVAPDSFYPLLSIIFMVGAVIGGLNSLWGPLFGAMFIQFVPNIADDMSKSVSWAIYGLFMVACVFLMHDGIAGAMGQVRRAIARRTGTRA
ncbi:MAG: branched-chain amino acid ABC transporter permease [Burkholderiales bacterium]|nr:branched-chain amino acid ABC transporter permease [Burkholderiales bacterium]